VASPAVKIQFKTGGLFVEHLPAGSTGNTAELEVPQGATPMDVMRQLGMPTDENYLVSLNGEVVVISERGTRVLTENDHLAIMPPLKGG
jgi:sulfur-carrier protein